jgi:hypothetical protein
MPERFRRPSIGRRIERAIERKETREEEAKRLKELLEKIVATLTDQGIPVDQNCRIDMNAFMDIEGYGQEKIKMDVELVREVRSSVEENLLSDGERLEALKTIVFHKFLHKRFVIVRASFYDDVENYVDNLIVEKETGNIVCAFDEVSVISGRAFAEKQERVLRNNKNGAKLKYGILLTKDGLKKGRIKNIPIFYLALPPDNINEGIRNLTSLEEISDYEKKLWIYFMTTLQSQIARLRLEKLNETVESRLLEFEEIIEELKLNENELF